LQAAVVVAQEADEQRLQERDGEGVAAEEHAAAEAVGGVEQGVDGAEREDGVEDGPPAGVGHVEVDEDVADNEAEPADFDGDGLGGQLPAVMGWGNWCLRRCHVPTLPTVAPGTTPAMIGTVDGALSAPRPWPR